MKPTRNHTCPTCGLSHDTPMAHRIPAAFLLAIAFSVTEGLAALNVGGWLAVALWAIVAWNILRVALVVVGLSIMATNNAREATS